MGFVEMHLTTLKNTHTHSRANILKVKLKFRKTFLRTINTKKKPKTENYKRKFQTTHTHSEKRQMLNTRNTRDILEIY